MEKLLVYNNKTYENFSITEHGEVKNLKTNHVYKNGLDKAGYCKVYLPMGERGKVKAIRVHKAVAETFIPNPNKLPIVHHKDENKANPDISNLQWATHKENMKYHYDELKNKTSYYNNRKLNENDIFEIKKYANMGFSRKSIADKFNVSKTTITNLLNGKSYNCM